jgi:hypothetical protein
VAVSADLFSDIADAVAIVAVHEKALVLSW